MKIKSIVTAALAASMAALGAPAIGTIGVKAPTPPGLVRNVDKKQVQRWRRDFVRKRYLRWRGVGLFSRGPRWPIPQVKRKIECKVVASDHATYLQLNTGEMVRYPQKVHRTRPVRRMIRRFRQEASRGTTA